MRLREGIRLRPWKEDNVAQRDQKHRQIQEVTRKSPLRVKPDPGAGAESSDSTLAAARDNSGRAALDAATRIILDCVSSGTTLLACPPARRSYDPSLAQPETPCSKQTLRSCVCWYTKTVRPHLGSRGLPADQPRSTAGARV